MTWILAPELLLDGLEARAGWGIAIDHGTIVALGPVAALQAAHPGATTTAAPGMLAVPGTINAHSHSFQSLLRGLGDDQPFNAWRHVLYHFMPRLDEEGVYTAALFAFAEMLRGGITTVCDFFYLHHGGNAHDLAVAQAARDLGIRLVLGRTMMDWHVAPAAFRETVEQAVTNGRALAAALQGDPLVTVIPAPHSPHGASGEMIQAGARLAAEWQTPWHIHVAEAPYEGAETRRRYGCGPLAWIAQLGALDERIRIVHGVWLEDEEIAALGRAGGGLIHCPGSNLFLGDGIAPVPKYLQAGVTVTLGCDSGSANNRLCLFDEMRLAATLQKGLAGNGAALTATDVFMMGTANGEHVTGLPVGKLAPGYRADIVLLRLRDLSLQPPHDLVRNLVYALNHRAIASVYVNGELVVRDGLLVRVPEEQIVARVRALTEAWAHEAAQILS
ncbi:amidohydrolase family protein [Thermorudis peleae]|uniref:amidohydrolase family protein n=1 Tax=Thermorudis peleae TaxID=1382356 RepID=UPI00056EFCE3|nr:amidohydrolase [Thermorudis peleae]